MKPQYYEALWHNCNICRIHYMSEQPHLRAYLCDDCWNSVPHFVVQKPKEEKMEQLDYKWWIALYTTLCIGAIIIVGYQIWIK